MRDYSIDHYNDLIELEAEYATFCRSLAHRLDDAVKADGDTCDRVRKIMETHDRNTLSKKLPSSVFASDIPASIMKFKA